MPNHFHFIAVPNKDGCRNIILQEKETHMQEFSKAIGKTLSSYTQAINLEQKRTGNLFQKKTKAKLLTERGSNGNTNRNYLITGIHYTHNNAYAANLTTSAFDWEFCSLPDYANIRNGTLCNKELLYQLTGLTAKDFATGKIPALDPDWLKDIF